MRSSAHHDQTAAFYRDLAGLPVIGPFAGSYGEDGTITALPGAGTQLKVVPVPPPATGRTGSTSSCSTLPTRPR